MIATSPAGLIAQLELLVAEGERAIGQSPSTMI
jgi:hypothetical protein